MANVFDQFDKPQGNVFDQFDKPAKKAPQGFVEGVKSDLQQRAQNVIKDAERADKGELMPSMAGLSYLGNTAGLGSDIIGRGLGAVTPEFVKEAGKNVLSSALDTDLGRKVADAAGYVGDKYGEFAQDNPNADVAARSLANIGGFVGTGIPIKGTSAIGSATKAVKAGGKAAAYPVVAPVKASIQGSKNLAKGIGARSLEELNLAGQAIKNQSSNAYKAFREAGAGLTPESNINLAVKIESDLLNTGKLNKGLHGKTLGVLKDMQKEVSTNGLNLEGLDQYRQLLSDVIRSDTDITGKIGADAFKAKTVIKTIDDHINKLGAEDVVGDANALNLLGDARAKWNQQRKFGDITRIIEKSGGDANKLKLNLQRLADNPKKLSGFTKEEIQAISDAAKNSTGEGLLKMAGKFGIDLGSSLSVGNAGLPALFATGSAIGGSGGMGAAVVAGGTAARKAQKLIARGKAERILNLIENGSLKNIENAGSMSLKDIMRLPPAKAKELLSKVKK